MALVQGKSLATTCLARRNMIWVVPDNWTMEEASTIPYAYSMVYYALVVRGKMKKGESILIHTDSDGIGLAAINVALHHGLIIYTTVSSEEKRAFLKKTFPQLKDAQIGDSCNTSFEQFIMRATKGRGVDLVLNSLANEKLLATVRCLDLNGRFLEIGKNDSESNSSLGMSVFLKNVSFHGILLEKVMESDDETFETIVKLVDEGIKNGAARPLPTTIFNDQQIEQAFRSMASGKHIGKVVVKIRDEEQQKIIKSTPKRIAAIPRSYMDSEKSYIIVDGLGDFGLELANWLVCRGATKLVLTSQKGVKTGYQSLMIRRWTDSGVDVLIDTSDVTTLKGAQNSISAANKLAPVGGVFNLTVERCDGLLNEQTEENFKLVASSKIDATEYLDMVSRDSCPKLDHFICFSSLTSGRDNVGKTDYGWANSVMERICEQRQIDGLPAKCIQWGATDSDLDTNKTIISGILPQGMHSCLQIMDLFMKQKSYAVLGSMVLDRKRNSDMSF